MNKINFCCVILALVLFSLLPCRVCADDIVEARKKHHHKILYGGGLLYYLTFLAIKVKLIFVLGIIFSVIIFGGKLLAVLKYAEHKNHHYHEPKEVYFQPSHHGVEYIDDHHDFSGPPGLEEHYKRYSTLNLAPNKYQRQSDGLAGYKRSIERKGFLQKFLALMMKLNLTDTIFREMKLEKTECRKKFVCETEWIAENSSLFRIAMKFMSDSTYEGYKTKNGTTSIEECRRLYPDCEVK